MPKINLPVAKKGRTDVIRVPYQTPEEQREARRKTRRATERMLLNQKEEKKDGDDD